MTPCTNLSRSIVSYHNVKIHTILTNPSHKTKLIHTHPMQVASCKQNILLSSLTPLLPLSNSHLGLRSLGHRWIDNMKWAIPALQLIHDHLVTMTISPTILVLLSSSTFAASLFVASPGFPLSNSSTCQDLCSLAGDTCQYFVWNQKKSTCSISNR